MDEDSVWVTYRFPSGSMCVSRRVSPEPAPHYNIHGAPDFSETARFAVAEDLRGWLNGGAVPWWFEVAKRVPEDPEALITPWGSCISAAGPSQQSEPGRGDWTPINTPDARIARGLLIESIIKRRWIE